MGTVKVVLRRSRKLKDGRYPLAIRLTHQKKLKYIFIGYSALEREWSGKYPLYLNSKHPNHKELNSFLLKEYSRANDELVNLNNKGKPFTVWDIHARIKQDSTSISLYTFIDDLISKLTESGRIGNAENYKNALRVIKHFTHGKDPKFEDINYKWLTDFEAYHYAKGNSPVSLSVYMRSLRSLFNKAIQYGLVDEAYYPFARNYFLFSFYTMGMNWVDMAHLKMRNIINGRIVYVRIKTKRKTAKSFSIKINPKTQQILLFYIHGKKENDYIFPIIKRDKDPYLIREDIKNRLRRYNENLERIRELCGIEQKLTSYVSRHSWASIAKKSGIDIGIISDALGHQDTFVTRTYLDSFGNDEIDRANDSITN